jgi:membrane protease YdiL (CAAX protease family)
MRLRSIFRSADDSWRTGWRIITMFVLLAAVIIGLNVAWKALGLPGRQGSGPWGFLLFASLTSGAVLGVIALLLRYVENRGLDAIGMPFVASSWKQTAVGTLIGAVPVSLLVGLALLAGYGTISPSSFAPASLAAGLLPMLLAGFVLAAWEEFVLRGYLLRQLSIGLNPMAGVVITGVLFGLMHSGNPGANWQGLLYTAIGGILMGLWMVRSGSLWLLIGYHFGWNATASALFGLELSGFEEGYSVFVSSLSGPQWLTGGDYGFEASLPAVIFEVLALSVVLRFTDANRSTSTVA